MLVPENKLTFAVQLVTIPAGEIYAGMQKTLD